VCARKCSTACRAATRLRRARDREGRPALLTLLAGLSPLAEQAPHLGALRDDGLVVPVVLDRGVEIGERRPQRGLVAAELEARERAAASRSSRKNAARVRRGSASSGRSRASASHSS